MLNNFFLWVLLWSKLIRAKPPLYSSALQGLFSEGLMQIARVTVPTTIWSLWFISAWRLWCSVRFVCSRNAPALTFSEGSIKHSASHSVKNVSPISNKHNSKLVRERDPRKTNMLGAEAGISVAFEIQGSFCSWGTQHQARTISHHWARHLWKPRPRCCARAELLFSLSPDYCGHSQKPMKTCANVFHSALFPSGVWYKFSFTR